MKNDLNSDTEIENLGKKRGSPKTEGVANGLRRGIFRALRAVHGNCILKGLAELLKGARCRPC